MRAGPIVADLILRHIENLRSFVIQITKYREEGKATEITNLRQDDYGRIGEEILLVLCISPKLPDGVDY